MWDVAPAGYTIPYLLIGLVIIVLILVIAWVAYRLVKRRRR